MNFAKGFLKMGAVLIIGTIILTGCGSSTIAPEKKASAVQNTEQAPKTENTSSSGSSKSLDQVDTELDQVGETLDKTLDSLDQTLDDLDFADK